MKLAEALQERADLNREIDQLKSRLNSNMLVQEGEQSAEDPAELVNALNTAFARLTYLTAQINLTNCTVRVGEDSLTELLAQKDALAVKIGIYKTLVHTAAQAPQRARGAEIRIRPTISVRDWQKQVNDMAKQLRLIDNRIQQTNWLTDLIE